MNGALPSYTSFWGEGVPKTIYSPLVKHSRSCVYVNSVAIAPSIYGYGTPSNTPFGGGKCQKLLGRSSCLATNGRQQSCDSRCANASFHNIYKPYGRKKSEDFMQKFPKGKEKGQYVLCMQK